MPSLTRTTANWPESAAFPVGGVNHLTEWFGERVELDGYFLDPQDVIADLADAGLVVQARVERQPVRGGEYPSRRCYLLAQRPAE